MNKDPKKNIRGNKALADAMGVCLSTIMRWRRMGLLDKAVAMHVGNILIYDLDLVYYYLSPAVLARRK